MAEPKVRWGVLSTANIGRRAVLPAIQQSNNGELVAVASRDAHRAQMFAGELGIPHAYDSYDELLHDPEIEAVYVPLPNSLHHEWTIKAAHAGKHILCEKPLALSTAECAAMEAAAAQHGVLLMEAFMYRFHPQTERVLELLRQGAVGAPRLIHAAFTFRVSNPANIRLQPELGGGALMDVGCYCVNVSRTLFESEPAEVQAYVTWGASGVDEQMVANLRFSDGRLAQFDCALTLSRREAYQVVGTDGQIDVPVAFLPGQSDTTIHLRNAQGETAEIIRGIDEYQLMIEHFGKCVREQATPRYPVSEAAANMRAIEALYRSARNGSRPEPVEVSA
jgi:xylose dehydrogenase (NAD/NADP)